MKARQKLVGALCIGTLFATAACTTDPETGEITGPPKKRGGSDAANKYGF